MWWWTVLGCAGPGRDRPRPDSEPTGHTGLPLGPPCDPEPVDHPVRLVGNPGHDGGRFLTVVDLERDGCDELLVTNTADRRSRADRGHLVRRPRAEGTLDVQAALTLRAEPWYEEWNETRLALVPAWNQLVVSGSIGDWRYRAFAFDVPDLGPPRALRSGAIDGRIFVPDIGHSIAQLARCRVGSTSGLCASLFDHDPDPGDFAGYTLLLAEPIRGELELVPNRVDRRYHGDPGDRAEVVEGDGDLDGDGRADLAIGAYNVDGARGAVAVLVDPPAGEHRVWDVATATVRGTAPGQEFGLHIGSGDLDRDGADDLVVGAPIGADDGLYVFRGPFRPGDERVDDAAEWIVRDGSRDAWLGSGAAIGDFDGDGRGDLAVGRPEDYYFGTRPGSVAIWFAPPPGVLDPASADLVLTSGSAEADAFGISVVSGDFDGDGLSDLAIGAPRDTEDGQRTGSVTVWHGAAIVAERDRRR